MNNYYGNRLVKIVSPQCDKVFSLELGGDEQELKDLIATILNIPISDLKGIKDTQSNYYTFSSALKNPQLTSTHSQYYTIVLGNSFANGNYQISQWPINSYANPPMRPIDQIKHKINTIPYEGGKADQILSKLLKGHYFDDKAIQRISQLLTEENNEELIGLFNEYNGYDLKLFAEKIQRVLSPEQERSSNQLITYSDILDSVEDHFDNKKDLIVLKKLLSFDNEHIIKVFQTYEDDCNMLKLVDNLNQMIVLYKDKFDGVPLTPHQKENKDIGEAEIREKKKNEVIEENYIRLSQSLSFDLKAILAYAKGVNENYAQLFEIEEPLKDKDSESKSIQLIQKFYDDFMKKNVYNYLSREELEYFNKIVNDTQLNKELTLAFDIFRSTLKVNDLKEAIVKHVKEQLQENTKTKSMNTLPIFKPKNEIKGDSDYVINNQKKEKSTITLKYKNSLNMISTDNEKEKEAEEKKKKEQESMNKQSEELVSTNSLNRKKLQEFTKVINTLSIEDQYKAKILQLLSEKEEKVVKIYENFIKNRMSLTKNVIVNVIKTLTINEKNEVPIQPLLVNSMMKKESNKKSILKKETNKQKPAATFDSVIVDLEKQKVISPGESAFIIKRYQNNDEMILSIWEVFKASDGELPDFIDSLQTFIAKHHAKSINLPEPVGAKTPISITNTKKEMLNLFRSNEKSEMNKIKNKQKQIIALLLKENLIEPSNYDFFNMKIDAEDHIVSSVFEVFSVTRDHRDFVETLNLIKDIMYNKDSLTNDPLSHQKNILNELLDKSSFKQSDKESIINGLMQGDQTILSALELYEAERDYNEAIDTLEIYIKKKTKKK